MRKHMSEESLEEIKEQVQNIKIAQQVIMEICADEKAATKDESVKQELVGIEATIKHLPLASLIERLFADFTPPDTRRLYHAEVSFRAYVQMEMVIPVIAVSETEAREKAIEVYNEGGWDDYKVGAFGKQSIEYYIHGEKLDESPFGKQSIEYYIHGEKLDESPFIYDEPDAPEHVRVFRRKKAKKVK